MREGEGFIVLGSCCRIGSEIFATGACFVNLALADLMLSKSAAIWAHFWIETGLLVCSLGVLLLTYCNLRYSSLSLPCLNCLSLSWMICLKFAFLMVGSMGNYRMSCSNSMGRKSRR